MTGSKLFSLTLLALCTLTLCASARAQTDERAQAAAEIESLRAQIKSRETLLLAPSREDREAYAEFLTQPGTGLVRLLPREKWDNKLSMPGGGAYYSFTRLTHEYGYGSDLSLEQGQFGTGFAGADFGFLINLGVVPLEEVTAESDGVRYLAGFDAPSAEPGARAEQRRTADGFGADGRTYKSRLPVIVKQTYALRSVNYHRSDVLVAFRVVRQDEDGSVVLLWKLLKNFPTPALNRSAARAGA